MASPLTRPTFDEILSRVQTDYDDNLEGTDARLGVSNTRIQALVIAGGIHLAHGRTDRLIDQFFEDTAVLSFLDRRADIRDILRNDAAAATGKMDFTGDNGETVTQDSEWVRADGAIVTVDADVIIVAGVATANVTAVLSDPDLGLDSNAVEGTEFTALTGITGIDSQAFVAVGGLTGGVDIESDDDLRTRLLDRLRSTLRGGNAADYRFWARMVPGVTRVFTISRINGDGTVGLSFVLDNDPVSIIPGPTVVAQVETVVSEFIPEGVKELVVFAPTPLDLDADVRVDPFTTEFQDAIDAEIDEFTRGLDMGQDGDHDILNAAITNTQGRVRHDLLDPLVDIVVAPTEILVPGTTTFQTFP